jgi:aminobenzoyl-glutamate utilization protein A
MYMYDKVSSFVDSIESRITGYRRDFHKYAESAWTEFRTASLIARRLTELGYEVRVGKEVMNVADRMGVPAEAVLERHYQRALEQGADPEFAAKMRGGFPAVVGILKNGEGPVVAMRFDFDAVDMKETKSADHRPVKEGFASVNDEAMHSCGHDGHAAIGLGVAETLMQVKDQVKGTVKLIFQNAEEGVRGAKAIATSGILDDVQYIYAAHLGSGSPVGGLVCSRDNFLATAKFDAFFTGAPAHAGGKPEGGHNAMLAAATAVLNLYAIPRHSGGSTRINVGRLNAGTGRNVICPNAHLAIETRGETSELQEHMYNYAMRVLEAAAAMHGCTVETVAMGGAQSGKSNKELALRAKKVADNISDFTRVLAAPPSNAGGGSEDFSYMMERVQQRGGQATFVGVGADLGGWGHHTAEFDFDESAMKGAVKLFTLLALDIMQEPQ